MLRKVLLVSLVGISAIAIVFFFKSPGHQSVSSDASKGDAGWSQSVPLRRQGLAIEAAPKVPSALSSFAVAARVDEGAVVRVRNEMARAQRAYELELGISLPERYGASNDIAEMKKLAASGDKYAAARAAQLLQESGAVHEAISMYQLSAELGLVAPLAEISSLLEPGKSAARDYLIASGMEAPVPDPERAYASAYVAYLRGYEEAFHLVDRMRRSSSRETLDNLDRNALIEHVRLLDLYFKRNGRYPSIEISSTEQMNRLAIFQANFIPRKAINQGGDANATPP